MLGLKLQTDPHWANIAESNITEILTDHAWCEQKAATNCISIIVAHPEITEIVDELLKITREELAHFEAVHQIIKKRNLILGRERKDEYVNELFRFMRRGEGRDLGLVDRLLFSALIEARSCERFRVLSENISDKELKAFYKELMISEANHYILFLSFARKYGGKIDVEKRWEEWLAYEAKVIASYGNRETIHG